MGAYARQNGEWVAGSLRARNGSEWTGGTDNGYVRDDGAWVQFQPDGVTSPLVAPTNLSVVAETYSALFTWTNPTQDAEPTHIQYRIPDTTQVWTEVEYPATSAAFGFLIANTPYQIQIRYIIRSTSTGQITEIGPVAEAFFTTEGLSGPGTPAADPGGSGGDSIVTWPNTVGTPGPVGGTDCWWEYIVQIPNALTVDEFDYVDSDVTGSIDGDIGDLAINFVDEGLGCGIMARIKYREVCDSVPGTYSFGAPFFIPCDWASGCGGITGSTFDSSPFDDAIQAMPIVCAGEDDPLQIEDAVVDTVVYGKQPAFGGVYESDDGYVISASNDAFSGGEAVVAGFHPTVTQLTSSDDASFAFDVLLSTQPNDSTTTPGGFVAGGTDLVRWGKAVYVHATEEGSGFTIRVDLNTDGDTIQLESTTEMALNQWHVVAVRVDQDGDKELFVNNTLEDTDSSGTACDWDGAGMTGDVELYGNANARMRRVAAWDRLLTDGEIGELEPKAYPYYVGHSTQQDLGTTDQLTLSVPSATATGDLMIVCVHLGVVMSKAQLDATVPGDWTYFGTPQTSNNDHCYMYKVATSASESDFTLTTPSNSTFLTGIMTVWRNVETDTITDGMLNQDFAWESPFNSGNESIYIGPQTIPTNINARWPSYWEGTTTLSMRSGFSGGVTWGAASGDIVGEPDTNHSDDNNVFCAFEGWVEEFPDEWGSESRATYTHSSTNVAILNMVLRAPRTDRWLEIPHVCQMDTDQGDGTTLTIDSWEYADSHVNKIVVTDLRQHSIAAVSGNDWIEQEAMGPNLSYAAGDYDSGGRTIEYSSARNNQYTAIWYIANARSTDPLIESRITGQDRGGAETIPTGGGDEWHASPGFIADHVDELVLTVLYDRGGSSTLVDRYLQDSVGEEFPDDREFGWGQGFSAGGGDGDIVCWDELMQSTGVKQPIVRGADLSPISTFLHVPIAAEGQSDPTVVAPSVRDVTSPWSYSSGETIPMPTHQAGDLLLICASNPPSGYSSFSNSNNMAERGWQCYGADNNGAFIYGKWATSSNEEAPTEDEVQFGTYVQGVVMSIQNTSGGWLYDEGVDSSASLTQYTQSVTDTQDNNTLVVGVIDAEDYTVDSWANGWTEQGTTTVNSGHQTSIGTISVSSAGSVNDLTVNVTDTGSDDIIRSLTLHLRPG